MNAFQIDNENVYSYEYFYRNINIQYNGHMNLNLWHSLLWCSRNMGDYQTYGTENIIVN